MEAPKCQSMWGHKYEARFDKGEMPPLRIEGMSGHSIESFCKLTYVHDICVRCGHVVKRERP